MTHVKRIHGTKIKRDEFVNLLNRWQSSALKLVLTIFLPEVTTMLTIVIDKVELPTVTVALERGERLSRDTIDVHFKGCVLERFEGDTVATFSEPRHAYTAGGRKGMVSNDRDFDSHVGADLARHRGEFVAG